MAPKSMIEFDTVWKTFPGGVTAVRDLTLTVMEGETLVLLGTSGSGKTTTMKMVNRLIDPSQGTITIDGRNIMDQNPVELRRGIGYAIQHIGLFPHMTIAENVGAVPSLLGWGADKTAARVDELLGLVGLDPESFRNRYPAQLSGGQRQRIGVARALAADPPIVLMDEPFGALDPITREQLQNEFLELESEIQKTVIFVTHDITEAVKMGDRIAVIDQGTVQQVAPPRELVESPANEFVEAFLGRHRFQLSLLTHAIADLMEPVEAEEKETSHEKLPSIRLNPRSSIIDALDEFKHSKKRELPVYEGRRRAGVLRKEALETGIGDVLRDVGEK